jgi:hypothetical protein
MPLAYISDRPEGRILTQLASYEAFLIEWQVLSNMLAIYTPVVNTQKYDTRH